MFTVTLFAKGTNKAAPQGVGGDFDTIDTARAFVMAEFARSGFDAGDVTTSTRFGAVTIECTQHGYQIDRVRTADEQAGIDASIDGAL